MAQIGNYPVAETVSLGDQLLTVKTSSGDLVKVPVSLLSTLFPSTFIDLPDTPGSFLGEQGKTLAVNSTEDKLEFVPNNLAPNFITLPDTPVSYAGQAGKYARVNPGNNALEFALTSFLEGTDTPSTYVGKAKSLLRVKETEDGLEFFPDSGEIPNVVIVNEESDLPAVNGAGEHELEPSTAYWFTTSITLANPLRYLDTETEVFGNSIGNTKITYTGAGYALRATNGVASIRLRSIQVISATGDGFEFIGGGPGSGTNVSLDSSYVIAPAGRIGTATDVDIFFATAAVMLGAQPVLFSGTCDLLYIGASRFQSTAVTELIDLGTSVWQIITCTVVDFRGVAGTTAIKGLPSSGNISATGSGQFANCTVESGLIAQSGITSADIKWRFQSNVGIPDSNTIAMAYITASATTNVVDGVVVPIAGTFTAQANTERATVSAGGVISFLNDEEEKGIIDLTFTASKLGGGTGNYIFKAQKDSGSGYVDVEGMVKEVTLTSGTVSSITLFGIEKYKEGDDFRTVVVGNGTSDDIDVDVTQFIIGG